MRALIDAQLLKDFKETVLARYGKLYAAMGEAVEEALKEWIKKPKGKSS